MAYKHWKDILRWHNPPNFSSIHHLTRDQFNDQYYVPDALEAAVVSLRSFLEEDIATADKLIIARPGSGKTTFVYYLKNVLASPGSRLNEKFVIEILHFNRCVTADREESGNAITERYLDIYKRYFLANGCGAEFETINSAKNLSISAKINRLLDMLVREKGKFSKKLIIVVDDIDEAPKEQVESALKTAYSYMEPVSIQKWLCVRQTTLDNYGQDLLGFVKTKFPEKLPFPIVDLHGIVEKRIRYANPTGKNPFSSLFCNQILAAYNNDIREAMGVFHKFFEINPPGKMPDHTSEEFIENFLRYSFTRTLINQNVFPNIFLNSRNIQLPLERDIFLLLGTRRIIDTTFFNVLEAYYTATVKSLKQVNRDMFVPGKITVSSAEVDSVITYLANHQLIDRHSNTDCFPTPRGQLFLKILKEQLYREVCSEEVRNSNQTRTSLFWALLNINPQFESAIAGSDI